MSDHTTILNNEGQWHLKPSNMADRTLTRRQMMESLSVAPNPNLRKIDLSFGDPTLGGVLKPHPVVIEAVVSAVQSGKYNGYAPVVGSLAARTAIACKFSTPENILSPDDIILANGCSSALDIAILGVANPGDNILIPIPSFYIYETLASPVGIECRPFNLLPDRNWEADLVQLESLVDKTTRAIVINNPSNPCGSVWSAQHIRDIIAIAERHRLLIIADELYWEFVFSGHKFISFSSQSKHVPIISCRGISKCHYVPGWRIGWLQIHDRDNKLVEIGRGLRNMAHRIMGPTSIVDNVLPTILSSVPSSFFKDACDFIERNAEIAYGILSTVPGLEPIKPQGSMFLMVRIAKKGFPPEMREPLSFARQLLREQSVACQPTAAIKTADFFRLVMTFPHDDTRECCERIGEFCRQHYKQANNVE